MKIILCAAWEEEDLLTNLTSICDAILENGIILPMEEIPMIMDEPANEVFVSAYSGPSGIVIHHPSIIQALKSPRYALQASGVVHVLPNEIPPQGAEPITTYLGKEKVVVKDYNGMGRGTGRYYYLPSQTRID